MSGSDATTPDALPIDGAHPISSETREAISFCRICAGGCGIRLTIDNKSQIVSMRGDPTSPLSDGYACFKGLQAEDSHHGAARLLHSLKRQADGSYRAIPVERALDEIAIKLGALIERRGPEAVALFCGNGAVFNSTATPMQRAFLAALGSRQYFTTWTIDQSGKNVSAGRLGSWAAGHHDFEEMDTVLLFGTNPLVSHAAIGILSVDPTKRLKRARANGLKVIVVDPRRTETARNAAYFLQPYPGQDAAIAGGLMRIILDEGWHDRAFCERYVGAEGIARLREAVDPLTEEFVTARSGIEPGQLRTVAEMFARDARIGCAYAATGVNMAPFSNLAQHMVDLLNVLLGRFLREGEPIHRRNIQCPPQPASAEVVPPSRSWEAGGESRIRGAHMLDGERPTGTLTDEILTPGEDQIRALFIDGGDPMTSFPDQQRTLRAFEDLELLVAIEPWPTPTSRLAHYVIAPTMQYERTDMPINLGGPSIWPGGWAQYTAPVLPPPAGSDVVHDWYALWSIAKRLGRQILFDGSTPLDMDKPPTCDDLLSIRLKGSPITLDELKSWPHGHDFGTDGEYVQPGTATARFDVMPDDVAEELANFIAALPGPARPEGKSFPYLLSVRRFRDFFNSNGTRVGTVRKRNPFNPANFHPDDLAELGLKVGDRVELESAHGRVVAVTGEDADLRRGVVTLAHGWGTLPGSNDDPITAGACVNLLVDTDRNFETINAMPHMSAVPIRVHPLAVAAGSPS